MALKASLQKPKFTNQQNFSHLGIGLPTKYNYKIAVQLCIFRTNPIDHV